MIIEFGEGPPVKSLKLWNECRTSANRTMSRLERSSHAATLENDLIRWWMRNGTCWIELTHLEAACKRIIIVVSYDYDALSKQTQIDEKWKESDFFFFAFVFIHKQIHLCEPKLQRKEANNKNVNRKVNTKNHAREGDDE